ERVHRHAVRILKSLPFRKDLVLETTLSNLALVLLCRGDYETAERLFSEAISSMERNRRFNRSISMIILHCNLGATYLRQNKLAETQVQAAKALEIAEQPHISKRHPIMSAPALALHAGARMRLGKTESAYDCYIQALERYDNTQLPRIKSAVGMNQARAFAYL